MGDRKERTGHLKWKTVITPSALKMIKGISDARIRKKISDVIDRLASDPEKQGKPLVGELADFRSIRAVGQRYRIIYTLRKKEIIVVIVGVGIRREGDKADIYKLAQKLIRLRLIE